MGFWGFVVLTFERSSIYSTFVLWLLKQHFLMQKQQQNKFHDPHALLSRKISMTQMSVS